MVNEMIMIDDEVSGVAGSVVEVVILEDEIWNVV